MALSRWSHSEHYIYECDDDRLQVCLFGHFTSREILNSYDKIEAKAKAEGYGFLDRLELRLYLLTWARRINNLTTRKVYSFQLRALRGYGEIKRYVRDPWDSYFDGELPHQLQGKRLWIGPISDKAWEFLQRNKAKN